MFYVLGCFTHTILQNDSFKRQVQALSFVPKKKERVRSSGVFDPRNDTLKRIFAQEDVFPVGDMYNEPTTLVILEKLGMKNESNVTARDLFHSANQISRLSQHQTAIQKSKAILHHLNTHPKMLRKTVDGKELGLLLMKIQWLTRLRQKASRFPPSLALWKTKEGDECFFKPTELKSPALVNLVGTVKPVLELEPLNEVSEYFGWQKLSFSDVALQLRNVIHCYSKNEKPYYMVILNEIYSFLSRGNYQTLSDAFQRAGIVNWVWNGDGFSSPDQMLSSKPRIDLAPYIHPLPSEVKMFIHLFDCFGVKSQSDSTILLHVLHAIKEKNDFALSSLSDSEVHHDVQLSVGILNELAQDELPPAIQEGIVIPVYIEDNKYVRLEPVELCMYSEESDWLVNGGDDEDMDYFYVHPNVPHLTAQRLGVPSLTNRMLDPDELFIGEEFGQQQKLTTCLNRLLDDYTDGFAVPKELIQNADDAGATEVRFLYDERTNQDSITCLLDKGMKSCHGPALWVYNDATFKDEDFVNITKLSEATKAHDTAKIGRFGLGFNAVYNLTDVPMFVSRNYLAIFDPHTSFLEKVIKNIRKPGIKINLNKNVKMLKKFKNQFKPFNGIFGCDLHLDKQDNSFDGTLFRFPLRTRDQALTSEIKNLWYNQEQMRELLEMFLRGAKNVLLFTQNVLRVGIYCILCWKLPDGVQSFVFFWQIVT